VENLTTLSAKGPSFKKIKMSFEKLLVLHEGLEVAKKGLLDPKDPFLVSTSPLSK